MKTMINYEFEGFKFRLMVEVDGFFNINSIFIKSCFTKNTNKMEVYHVTSCFNEKLQKGLYNEELLKIIKLRVFSD